MSVNEKMTAIADNIRSKTGKTELLNLDDMASGVDEVYTKGENSGYDNCMLLWWDAITNKGKRTSCIRTFMSTNVGDIEGIEKMPYPLKLTGQCDGIFNDYWGKKLLPKKLLDLTGIKTTYDNSTVIHGMFTWWTSEDAGTTEGIIPDYGIPAMSYYTQFCYRASAVGTIEIIRCHENTEFSQSFDGANNLKNITFEGTIGKNISFSSCPLTVASMKSIITHLKNYAGTENAGKYTLTLKDSCKSLMAQQGAVAELDGKTYDAYIADIGWNLA